MGDFGQLDPVKDTPLYSTVVPKNAMEAAGCRLFREQFQGPNALAVVLSQVFRQQVCTCVE